MNGRIVNSLSGVPGIRGFSDNMECIVSLRDCWAARYPEAGPHYLALRCWGLLIWQPIYLSVISVECSSAVPDITQICQPVPEGGFICSYDIAEHSPYRSCISDCMNFSARQLQMMCRELYYELTRIVRLGPRAAACMQADCVLGAILAIKKCDSSLENARAIKRTRRWLDALSLGGCSGFFLTIVMVINQLPLTGRFAATIFDVAMESIVIRVQNLIMENVQFASMLSTHSQNDFL